MTIEDAPMKKWFEKLSYKMQQWMQGRYGSDELNIALCYAGLVFFILSLFTPTRFLGILAIALILWSCIRCFSRDLAARSSERDTYLKFTGRIQSWFRLQKNKWRDRKSYRYFRCEECKMALRVPKGKGNIRVTCPHCHHESVRKT